MTIINFFIVNWDSVLIVLGLLVVIILSIRRGETSILKDILFSLVTKAEQEFGSKVGVLKYAYVADAIYQRIPAALKLLYSSKSIQKMIEEVLAEAKKKWDSNANLQDYIDKPTNVINGLKETVTSIADSAAKTAIENGTQAIVEAAIKAVEPITEKKD